MSTWSPEKTRHIAYNLNRQNQPPEVFYKKRFPQKFVNIHRKTPVLESF